MQAFWLLLFFAGQGLAQRSYFQFDTRSGDYQYGPDGSVQYTGSAAMPALLGTVTVSSGTTTVNGQTIPRGMQIWTVGTTGWYDVMAAGASGADALKQTGSFYGGRGVAVRSKYFLTAGTQVAIAVGMKPTGCSSSGLYGAGGGSFVTVYAATGSFSTSGQHTLILAAGGGGSVGNNLGVDASTTTTGNKCRANPATAAATAGGGGGGGAAAGGAGAIGSSTNSAGSGGGGGGFLADGGDGYYSAANQETKGGKSFLGGGAGGFTIGPRDATACSVTGITSPGVFDPPGGFGGGGGGWNAGGGGGGYSGGQACGSGDRQGGGGGGSYDWNGAGNAGTLYSSWDTTVFGPAPTGYASGYMSGDGRVAISLSNQVPVFSIIGQNNAGTLRKIDLGTKTVSSISFTEALVNVGAVTISPDGTYALVPNCAKNVIQKVVLGPDTTSLLAGTTTASRIDGVGTNAGFRCPRAMAIYPDNSYSLIADRDNNAIRKLDLTSLAVTTIAGTCSGTTACTAGMTDGATALTSTLGSPQGVAIHPDGTSAFVADNTYCLIRKLTLAATVTITTIAGTGTCVSTALPGIGTNVALGLTPTCRISPGGSSLVLPDRSAKKMRVMDLSTLAVTNAINVAVTDLLDGDLMGSQTSYLCVDYSGFKILQITNPGGVATTLAGSGSVGTTDGVGTSATLNYPITVTVWRCSIPGYGIVTSDSVCERCPLGTYSSRGEVCLTCPSGTYSSAIGASSCTACPANARANRLFTACLANAGYYIGSSGVQFPPSPFMSDFTFTSGSETFAASASSYFASNSEAPWKAFSGTASVSGSTNQWTTSTNPYSGSSSGAYTGTYSTTVDGGAILGEWLQLQSTKQHTLGSFSITACNLNPTRGPKSFVLAGSNDGITWVSLAAVSGEATWTANQARTYTVPQAVSVSYFRLIVTNTTGTSDTYLTIDKLKLYDSQISACSGTCASGTKFCSPDGTSSVCCTASQYFIPGVSTACTNCPANSAADLVYQERCVANAGYFGPTLYMFDGSQGTYQNLGSKTSHTVTPVGWRPTFGSVGSRYGAYFDSSVNGNYYKAANNYYTVTLAFWIYVSSAYVSGVLYEVMGMYSGSTIGMAFVLGPDASIPGLYVVYGTNGGSVFTTAAQFPVNTWLHTVLVIPSGSDRLQRVYVNGVKAGTRSNNLASTQDLINYQTLMLGAGTLNARYFRGYLQQLTMYNYAMSDAEVTALYNSGTPNVFVACSSTCSTGLIRHCLITGATVCCPPGTFFREETDTACQSCPAGTYSGTSASSCTLCPSGTFSLRSSQILASACQSCPNNSTSNSTRTGCVANTGFYNLDANLLAYYPFRPENIYADASYSGYGLINTNGASFKPQTEYNTAPFQGAGVAYFNNAGAGMSGVTVTSATGSEVQSFQVPATAWTLASYVGTSSAPGAGFSWCYWIRGADGSTAGTLNTVQYPFVSWLGTCFCNAANAAFSGFYDGRNNADANGGGGTNYWIKGVSKSGVGPSGVYTRYWQHVCFTWQGTTFRAYVNCASSTCSASASTTLTAEVFSDTLTNVYIGQGGYGTAWFGWLSDFRYYKKALTPAEVFAVRSYAGATSFSANQNPQSLAYFPFNQANIYAVFDNPYKFGLYSTNGLSTAPTYDSTTAPYTGANAVLLDNNNVAGLSLTSKSFKIGMGSGFSFGYIFGTAAAPGPGISVCGWYRGQDGPTAGTVNTVNSNQALFTMLNQPLDSIDVSTVIMLTIYREGVTDGISVRVRSYGSTNTLTVAGKYVRTWTHLCAVGYGQTVNLYFNCASSTCAPSVLTTGFDFKQLDDRLPYAYIGQDNNPPWYGWVSQFRMYSKTLTAAEVFAIKSYDGTNPTGVNSVNAGLLAYYPFQPNAFLVDASGVTGTLTNTGSVTYQAGTLTDLQNAAYFAQASGLAKASSTPQYLTIPSITIGGYFSICVWYNPDGAYSVGYSCVVLLTSGGTSNNAGTGDIQIRRDSSSNPTNLVIQIMNGNTGIGTATYAGLYQSNVWQHVCLTVSGTTANVYYNGVLQATTITLSAQHATTTFTTSYLGGMNPYQNDLYRGQLDELRIYSRAISASEVTSIYNFRGDTYTPAIIVQCPPCSAGSYGGCTSGGTATCTNCPAGTYSTGTGLLTSGDCASCQAGSYATATGVTACTNCPANSWSTGGTSKCTANVGYYNLDDSTNLKAYYTFNPGALLQDVTGTTGSLTASASSPTAQASGPFGASSNSAFMTGSASTSPSSNQYFSVPSMTLPDSVSICSWFWISPSITRNWNRIWDFGNGASSSNVLGAIYYNTNNFGVDVYRGSTSIGNRAVTNGALETSTWKHACMTLSGTSQVVWINGVSTSYTMTNTRDPSVQLTVNYLGRSNWASDLYWYGAIDEFRIYYKALTSTEVAALYAFRGDTYVPMIMLACPNPCGAGTYGGCTASGAQSCTGCPAGSFSTGVGVLTSANCTSCAAGTFKSTTGASVCDLCPAGKYSATVGAVTDPCLSCSAGTYSTGSGLTVSSVCLLCVAGTYSVTLAATSSGTCTACVAGTYSGVSGATISSTCTACAAGTYSGTTGASSIETCTACVAGTYSGTTGASSSATCTACPAGKYSGASAATVSSACTNCPAGTYSGTTGASLSSACTSCPAGTYSGTTGASLSSVCTPCSAGKYSGTAGASSSATCTSCPAGTYSGATGASLSSACTACVAGTYSGVTGASSSATCTACAAGTYSALPGATAVATCSNCPAGTYQTGAGFTSIANCSLCQAGTYSLVTAATSSATCTACTGGSFSSSAGASVANACQTCSNGYFSLSGASVCSACAAGSYGGGAGITACPLCSAGQYSTGLGLLVCTACSAGTFSITQGSTTPLDCQTCAAGTYASVAGQTSCVSCASLGTVCAAGSTLRCPLNQSTPLCCGKNQFFREGVDLACQNCPVATFSMDGAGTACGACLTSPIGYRLWTNDPLPAAETSYDVGDYKVLAFTNEQYPYGGPYVTFGQDVDATFLIIGGGASGGSQWGGGGGAGGVMFMPQWRFPAGSDYRVQAGPGGDPFSAPYGGQSYIGKQTFAYMSLMGGGQGGGWPGDKANKAGMGGSGGGGGACNATYCSTRPFGPANPDYYINYLYLPDNPALTKYVLGNVGGYGSLLNDGGTAQIRNGLHGGGGGGAGGPGESETAWTSSCASNNQAACGRCGNGGDGVAGITIDGVFYNFSTVFGSAYTKRAKGGYVAGGGGGGGYSSYGVIKCKGGLGGGGAGYQWSGSTLYTAENGAAGTGSGGGGASDFTTRTYGGSGLVLIKMSRICVCPGGMYAGTDGCASCAAGTYMTGTGQLSSAACLACAAGSYSSFAGASNCSACDAGKYLTYAGASSSMECLACDAGTYQSNTGVNTSAGCTACDAGKYSVNPGASLSSTCVGCPAGSYGLTPGASSSDFCTLCAAGTYGLTVGGSQAGVCLLCPVGTYSATTGASLANTCSSCPAGTYSGVQGRTDACDSCPAGTYSGATGASLLATCQACSAGSYSPTLGATLSSTCQSCQAGTFQTGTGMDSSLACTACDAGFYSTGVGMQSSLACITCSAGTYQTGTGMQASVSCTSCSAGQYSTASGASLASACQLCSAGTYFTGTALSTSASCSSCLAGQYSTASGATIASTCQLCSTGTFSTAIGASSVITCTACAAGTYGLTAGLTICTSCSAGTYSVNVGATLASTCQLCQAGTFQTGTGMQSSLACMTCSAGSYATGSGMTTSGVCTNCPAGSYSTGVGMATSGACTTCSAGSYSTMTGVTVCTNCPANSWSTGGISKCTANLGYYNLDDGTNLKAYYTFNPGALLQDVTGTTGSLTASASSPTSQASGPFGANSNSAFMTGSASTSPSSNQYFTLPSLTLPDSLSICSWFWISPSITRNYNRIWDFGNGATSSNIFTSVYSTSNDLYSNVYRAATIIGPARLTNGAVANVWTHVCLTLSGTSEVVWLNGVSTSFTMTNTRDSSVQLKLNYLGRSNWNTNLFWYGAIDEFRIYYKTLTSTEIAALYAFRGDTYVPMIILACPNPCTAGSYGGCTASGAQSCTVCLAGSYSTGVGMLTSDTCTSCAAGTFKSTTAASACDLCPAGKYSAAVGAATDPCLFCSAGTYSTGSGVTVSSVCLLCGAGTYSVTLAASSSGTCQSCQAGTFQTGTGMQSSLACTACDAGYHATGIGLALASNCTACTAGTYGLTAGLTICTSCSAGTYSEATAATLDSTCQLCPAGTYSGEVGASLSSTCLSCSAGYYSTGSGLTTASVCQACTVCVPGQYRTVVCTAARNSECTDCQAVISSARNYPPVATNLSNSMAITTFLQQSAYKEVRNINADSVSWGSGTYEFYQSTVYGVSYPTSLLFNGIRTETIGGHWATYQYTSGTYNSQNHYIINDYFGDWVIIKLPLPVILTKFIFYRRDANLERRSPGAWKCYGSRDGVNFFEVAAASQTTKVTSYSSGSYTKIVTPQPVVAYQYYGWVVNKFLGSDHVLNFGELEFWAQEPPTYSTTTDASVCTSCTTCGEGETLVSACNTTSNAVCRQCQAGTYSQQGNCTACASGTYSSSTGASSSASCTACSAGTYSTASGAPGSDTCVACAVGTYMTEQGGTVCTACPASSTTLTTGRAQRGDCICNAGFFGNLTDLSQNCTACPANSFCAGLSQTACPVHTHSPAQSSLPIQCRCDAGYKCSYRRDASVTIRFDNMDSTQFTSQSDSIKAKLASTADVPVGNVSLVYVTRILYVPPPPPPPSSANM